MSVVSVLRLPVRDEAVERIADAYRDEGVFTESARSGGFLGARLLRPEQLGDPFLVVAEWETRADYDRWLASSRRAETNARLAEHLHGEVPPGELYEVAFSSERNDDVRDVRRRVRQCH